jgi:RND family efflux transporter MFP subunit
MTNFQRIVNIILLPVVIVIAVLIIKIMIANKPERPVKKPQEAVPTVSYSVSAPETIHPNITTYGNVNTYNEAQLASQVKGEILHIAANFNSGKTVAKGDLLVEIDPADYLAELAQQEATLASAQQALEEEKIRSEIAAQDWIESGRALKDAKSLTLRKPQLGAAEAAVASAQASLQKAKLDLERTKIRAPFDAIVQSRSASLGDLTSVGTALGTLIAIDRAEVRLPLTPQQVQRLKLPMHGATPNRRATLTTPTQPNASWLATITRTEPSVDQQNQVIYIVGEIEKPFADPQAFLPIGAFVNAEIPGDPIPEAHRIPATALVEDAFAWRITEDNTLSKVGVTRLIADGDDLIVRFEPEINPQSIKVATRPLASFRAGHPVKPIAQSK